uniref:hypothetical protein n=1 Tax=Polaromonas sp. TaxID=1869339 RepID=UPI0015EF7003|nr:hypothetical protein [Polaromonas sp.]
MYSRTRIGSMGKAGHVHENTPIDLAAWVAVDERALPESQRELFLRRKRGIQRYLQGASAAELRDACGFGLPHIYRLITERCLKQHPDGTLYGWRGALPHQRVKAYARSTPPSIGKWGGGAVGALQWVFESPEGKGLEAKFRSHILDTPGLLETPRRPRLTLVRWFLKELQQRGFERRGEWPFNVEKRGYVSIPRFVDKVLDENPPRQRAILGGKDAQRKSRAGDGTNRPSLHIFDRVECDAHKLDARMLVLVPSPHGGEEARMIHRLWVVVIIEVVSRAVLGYHLSLRRECSAEDVLRAIKHALTQWAPRELQFSGTAYVEAAGLPSGRSPRYLGACWNEFSVDGALANICARVERPMTEVVGARVLKPQNPHSYSSRRSLDDRPFIESFFGRLAKGGFHRISTTTGSSPKDKQRIDPDAAAKATRFQLEYAEELLDTLIANYNATPHSGLGYRSPLDQLDFLASVSAAPIRVADAGEVKRMVGIRKLCTLLGGVHTGRRPYFNFANARYSAEWLCLRTDLIGKNLWLHIENEDDARYASVSTTQGIFLGAVRAAPPWHQTPHTLYMRQAIRALDKRRLLHLSGSCDAVEELVRYAESSPGKKLPPHPAYLEARRVLQSHAESLAGQSMVALAKSAAPNRASSPASDLGKPAPIEPEAIEPSASLPPLRMAQQW